MGRRRIRRLQLKEIVEWKITVQAQPPIFYEIVWLKGEERFSRSLGFVSLYDKIKILAVEQLSL